MLLLIAFSICSAFVKPNRRYLELETSGAICAVSSIQSIDIERAGPLAEYERRIAMGELSDGDSYQVQVLSCQILKLRFNDLICK